MIVVVIVGVLAALAVYGTRKYIISSKTSEATQMLGSIKSAQEVFFSDNMTYLDVSGGHALNDLSTFYPTSTPGKAKWAWGGGTGAIPDAWRALNVKTDGGGLYFTYGCAAGAVGDAVAAPGIAVFNKSVLPTVTNWPTAVNGPWYVAKAVADLDGDGNDSTTYVAASFTEQIFGGSNGE